MDMIRKCKQNKNHTCTPCGQNGSIGKEWETNFILEWFGTSQNHHCKKNISM